MQARRAAACLEEGARGHAGRRGQSSSPTRRQDAGQRKPRDRRAFWRLHVRGATSADRRWRQPCARFREQGRERYLSTDELARLGQVLRAGEIDGLAWPREKGRAASKHDRKPDKRKTLLSKHVIAAFRLLLFTGCRLREILRLRWSEVDLERGLLLLPDSKTGRKTVVLNAPARQVLTDMREISAGEYVILGDDPKKPRADLQKPWDLVKHHAKLEGVRLHDLRHTHASVGAGAGLGLQIIGKLLGHKHADTTARYAHLADDPLRRASDRIGSEIAAALGDHAVADEVRKLR